MAWFKCMGGSYTDYSNKTVTASAVTSDSNYTYLTIPNEGIYNTGSKVRTLNSNLGFSLKAVNANRGGSSANVISCLAIDDQKYKKIKITNITGGTPTYIRGFNSKADMINGSNYVTLGIGEYEINFKYILISYSSVPGNTAYENEINIT